MPASRRSSWVEWLLPDLAVLLTLVTFLYCLFVFDGATQLFRDSDTGWHIVNGESILRGFSLPGTDPYSFSRFGQPWFAWEWGADVIMGAAHRWDGLRGVALLFSLLIAACTWLWVRIQWTLGGNFFVACLTASPMLSTANLHWLARPHVFSWVLALGVVWGLERWKGRRGGTVYFVFALAGALWANVHASFLLLPVFCGAYALEALLRPIIWDLPADSRRATAIRFTFAALTSLAGTLLNPYGWNLHRHVASYLANGELLMRIGEFQSFNFHVAGAWQVLLTVLLGFAGAVTAFNERRLAHFFLGAGLVALSLRSARVLPLAALLALPLANGSLTAALRSAEVAHWLRRRLDQFLEYSQRLGGLDRQAGGAVWLPLAVVLAWVALHAPPSAARTGFPADQFPVAAAAEVAKLPSGARLFAPDKFGGYLIYRFQGKRLVFFDGRSDFYGVAFMKRYIQMVELRPGWRALWTECGFTHALVPVNYALAGILPAFGWKQLYADGTAVLLEAPR